jgi:hypothetical protein
MVMTMRDIGDMGEDEFGKLCSSVGLTRNKSQKDKTGWDYLVEFPIPRVAGEPADLMPPALQCRVQVKATDKHRRRWDVGLSNLERLAKSPIPAFICLLEFNGEENAKNIYLVHIGEVLIRRVLRRLRESEAVSDQRTKRASVSIAFSDSDRLARPNGACLKQAIEAHVPQGYDKYVQWKGRLLKTLGYEHGHGYVNYRFTARDPVKDLLNLELGLQDSLEVDDVSMHDTRFKIDRQLPLLRGRAKISMVPTTLKATIAFRERKSSPGIEFPAQLHSPSINHMLPREGVTIRVKTRFFDIIIEPFKGSAQFSLLPDATRSRVGLPDAASLLELLQMMCGQTNQGVWMIVTVRDKDLCGRIKGPLDLYLPDLAEGLRTARHALAITQACGIADRVLLSIDRLFKMRRQIDLFYSTTIDNAFPVTLNLSTDDKLAGVGGRCGVVVQARLTLGGYCLHCFFGIVGALEEVGDQRYAIAARAKSFHKYAWTKKDRVLDDAEQAEYADSVKNEMEVANINPTITGPVLVFEGQERS